METIQKNPATIPSLLTPFSLEVAEELLQVYGFPLYVYDSNILKNTISHITNSINYPRTKFYFASVTNGNISLLKFFKDAGWGLHANTPGDVFLGLKSGFYPSEIVYSGSNLNQEDISQLLDWGITTFNLDSISQLQLFSQVLLSHPQTQSHRENLGENLRIGLRLNVSQDSRIGVSIKDFQEAIDIASLAGLKITGLHFYRGTGTNATAAFTNVIDQVISIAENLPHWQYLDFGGGFGYPYHRDQISFNWHIFGDELTARLNKLPINVDLIIEPGRAAVAGCGTLLVQVVSIKWQGDKQIVGVNSTVANISVPAVHGGYREVVTWKNSTSETYLTDVCGNTTYSRDYLAKNYQLPALQIGDIIAILDVGAYGYAMSSHFLHRPKPAEILLENGSHRLIRKRENYNVLLNNQIV
ncbi:decarboxylase [Anabaena sp. FACHB-1237]|uniref:diaminopimelate decarboxylase family protein n=1 Tax=Anabaena sp. FACHB-1237 TaxID=2692769 RepID=UPI0016800E48|nr:decarboxylase [Anabaena sp. FACHB-1237]MBD2137734.1 decarboxylase [Anabaena sp. FACHB-1237]